ncbi:MAG TPA: hypothetical protein VIY08_00885 [Candidatus Nitrosocosmicus sp.]
MTKTVPKINSIDQRDPPISYPHCFLMTGYLENHCFLNHSRA